MTKFTKVLITATMLVFSIINIAPTFAAQNCANVCNSSCNVAAEVKTAAGCSGTSDKFPNLVKNILIAVIGVSSLISVSFIIVGGINYMTSTGDPTKAKKARDTIIYALIGLVICALAFAIVNWTIGVVN